MRIKKSGKHITGAEFTNAEQKAIEMELRKQYAEWDRKHSKEIDAVVLYQLHTQLGFGKDRLKRFFEGFRPAANELVKRYELDEADQIWIQTEKLKEIGVDLEEWYKECGL